MVKRISCRVISSVPLSKSRSISRRSSRSDDKRRKIGDTVAANVSGPGNSVAYTDRLGITGSFVDDGLRGQILDCYV